MAEMGQEWPSSWGVLLTPDGLPGGWASGHHMSPQPKPHVIVESFVFKSYLYTFKNFFLKKEILKKRFLSF